MVVPLLLSPARTHLSDAPSADMQVVARWGLAAATLSLLGDGAIIAVLLRRKRKLLHKSFWDRLVAHLTAANVLGLLNALTTLGPVGFGFTSHVMQSRTLCAVQGFGVQWLSLVTPLIVAILVVSLHVTVTSIGSKPERWEKWACGAAWLVPLAVAVLPLVHLGGVLEYGPAGSWCWVSSSDAHSNDRHGAGSAAVARLWFFYLWVWVAFGVIVFFGLRLWCYVHTRLVRPNLLMGRHTDAMLRIRMRVAVKLLLYAATYMAVWVPSSINRVVQAEQEASTGTDPSTTLRYSLQLFFVCFGGALNMLVFAHGHPVEFAETLPCLKWCCRWCLLMDPGGSAEGADRASNASRVTLLGAESSRAGVGASGAHRNRPHSRADAPHSERASEVPWSGYGTSTFADVYFMEGAGYGAEYATPSTAVGPSTGSSDETPSRHIGDESL